MKLLAVSCSADENAPLLLVKSLNHFLVNEEGMLPVFDIQTVTAREEITDIVKQALFESDKTIVLGTNHAITLKSFKACTEAGIVIFDDCPGYSDYLPALVEQGVLKSTNILMVGLRKYAAKEYHFLREKKIKIYPLNELMSEGILDVSDSVMSAAREFKTLYISISLNVLDPSFASGSEPGGLSTRELLFFLQRMKKLKNFKIADIVNITEERIPIAAKLIRELY